jgi:DNA-binding MarR family transcriptional regulator
MSNNEHSPLVDDAISAWLNASALLDPIRMRVWDSDGLTVTQLRVLGHLLEQEGLSNAELAERLYVTRPSVSALLERLERGGFIRREVAPNDRRGICIWLEPRGRQAISSFREEIREYLAGLMAEMSDADLSTFTASVLCFVEAGRQRRVKDLGATREGDD